MACRIFTVHKAGFRGEIFSSWLAKHKERKIRILFERGELFGNLIEKKLKINRLKEFPKEITDYKNNQIKDQLVDFIAMINREPFQPLTGMKDALSSARAVDSIRAALSAEPTVSQRKTKENMTRLTYEECL